MRRVNYLWSTLRGKVDLIAFFLAISYLSASAQDTEIKFTSYTTSIGLTQNSILAIHQDDEGFMWFGTYGGLNRFDGYEAIKFDHQADNPYSLGNNQVRGICQDTTGILFIATLNGVERFFAHQEKFVHFRHDPSDPNSVAHNEAFDIMKDSKGRVWVATWGAGLNRMERVPGDYAREEDVQYRFIRYKMKIGDTDGTTLRIPRLTEGPQGNIWFGTTENGLVRFNPDTEQVLNYRHDPNDPNSIATNNISSVTFDSEGNAWLGNWGGGVDKIDFRSERITHHRHDPNDEESLSHDVVMNIFADRNDNIWVGTWGGGLNRIVLSSKESGTQNSSEKNIFLRYQHSKLDKNSIGSNSIYKIFQSKNGIIWVGTDWGGVAKFGVRESRFRHIYAEQSGDEKQSLISNVIFSLLREDRSKLWIGTLDGLSIYDTNTGTFENFVHDPSDPGSLSNSQIKTMALGHKGEIWLGTAQGLNRYEPSTKSFKKYYINPRDKGATPIMDLLPVSDGSLWVGTFDYGLHQFSEESGEFERISFGKNLDPFAEDATIWAMVEDKGRNIWFGLRDLGLCKYNLDTKEVTNYSHDPNDPTSLDNNRILSLLIDHKETLWVGTNSGLNKMLYDESGKPYFKRYSKDDGLSDFYIESIIEDDNRQLWLSTTNGLNKFDPINETVQVFTALDGLQEGEFSIAGMIKDPYSDQIYAAGINGLNIFNPMNKFSDDEPPKVKIIGLSLFNKPVNVGDTVNRKQILDKTLSAKSELKLSYKENVLTLKYTGLHYESPFRMNYAFMLEGFEDDWNYVGNQRSATFTNLSPGRYSFKVKASNPDGVWSEIPTELTIIVTPRWWQTVLAKVVFAILSVLVVLSVYRIRVNSLHRSKKLLENLVGKRTEELKHVNVHLEEKQEEISTQNEQLKVQQLKLEELNNQLLEHRNNLELQVEERTSELNAAKMRADAAKLKAEESDRLKSSFLANMSHEVRTPMNAIIGFSTMLDDKDISSEKRREFIKMIHNSGNTLVKLINDILDISKIDADQLDLFTEEFKVGDVFKEVKSYFMLKKDKTIDIIYTNEGEKSSPYLDTDPDRFKQVVTNLVSNAIKYTEKGHVKFGYEVKGNRLEVFVDDTGIGINEEDQEHIFDYFYKIEKNKNKFYRGTGIGLSICKKLVDLMGSEIKLKSKEGEGSRFSFVMPVTRTNGDTEEDKPKSRPKNRLKDLNIVVAEDENTNFRLVQEILDHTGANLIRAKNGEEAVEITKGLHDKNVNFIVLMDIKMPVKNGVEAMHEIKDFNEKIPIMAVTAYAQAEDEKKMIKNGFDDYIAKPLNPDLLIDKIEAFT